MDDMRTVSRLLHSIVDFERIGDHARNLQESALELHEKDLHFSESAIEELRVLLSALDDILGKTTWAFTRMDVERAWEVDPMEETIDRLIEEMRMRHVRRLQSGECTMQLSFVLNDILANFERISDHCSNVASTIIQAQEDAIDRRAYLQMLRDEGGFGRRLEEDLKKYRLSER